MGTIICQNCNKTIEHFEGEKVTKLYAQGHNCIQCKSTQKQK
ncbi:GapA-binding peptide SR1P [Alkalihalophilus sp. As8PL]|uniref:GapA-binding peptide SR1P n=2 Tax=Alkalihalophilus TaxID=2893060 RepID=A0AB39BSK8_9BACI|nr:GapA-binding peptide SR1P [Alkalihalophilus lindianensis]MDV2685272.1 GapA-binding peptide SR1P [Alkalihalophilus lindianensis]